MGDLCKIKGIGTKIEKYFNSLGIVSIKDLLYYFPRDYESYDEPTKIIDLQVGKIYSVDVLVVNKPNVFHKGKLSITQCFVDDGTARIRAYWFNIPFISKNLTVGSRYILRGRVSRVKDGIALSQCKIYKNENYESLKGSLNPVYPLTKGLSNNLLKKVIKNILDDENALKDIFAEYLPAEIINERKLVNLPYAFKHIHFPNNIDDMMLARKRHVYDELFLFSLAMQLQKKKIRDAGRTELTHINEKALNDVIKELPYKLTKSQMTAIKDIIDDLEKCKRMNRLLEGDVGSGKTIVAILVAYLVSLMKLQTAIMAPTEVLAEQHFENLLKMKFVKRFDSTTLDDKKDNKIIVALLTGSVKAKERREILRGLQDGSIDIVVGTHALFSNNVVYSDLAFIVIDEQHRFGVGARKALEEKAKVPNVLAMSATPIPRTLAMLYYADMDISRLTDKPKDRLPIKNYIAKPSEREKSYRSMKRQIDEGHQVYVICASIEKSTDDNVGSFANYQNVIDYADTLKKFYGPSVNIGILHGKMKSSEKYDVMKRFKDNEIQILVSTTVVEVGVDVPNATYLMVEDAGSFGLATLHQLRGRVGRGNSQSYALFVDTIMTDKSKERLDILASSNDGFYLAEEDLRLRGPGDIFGVRQSGEFNFRLADMYTDIGVFRNASVDAKKFIEKGYDFTKELLVKVDEYLKMGYVI